MKPFRLSYYNLSALGLIAIFLATSVIIPVINNRNVTAQKNSYSISKAADNSQNQNGQLPLAENEKEEESRTERDAEYSFEFCLNQFMYHLVKVDLFLAIHPQIPSSLISPEVPLYLFKRTLLI